MLKNKKVAALLIAIQSVTFLPAVQADAADLNTVKSQNGVINDAVAFKNGTSCISGNIDGIGNGAFVLYNGKFNKLNNVASDTDLNYYGSKYADIHNGQYFVDLSSGTISSSNIQKSDNDDVSSKLNINLQNENQGRFRKEEFNNYKTLKELPKNKFSDGWYEGRYSLSETSTIINGGAGESTVYCDSNGNYIDADYSVGKISVGLNNGKTPVITNTHDKVENVIAGISNTQVIGQDSSNIYRLAEITVKLDAVEGNIISINGIKLDSSTTGFLIGDSGRTITFDVIQSLSKKADGERVLGIRYPKKVNNYLIGNSKGIRADMLRNSADGFSMCNGKLMNYRADGAFIEAESIDLKSSSNFDYIEINNKSSVRVNNKVTGYDFDVNGSLFVLSENNIYKFNTDKGFESLYSLDDKYSDISVYDGDNIVAWNKQAKKYVIVGGHSLTASNANAEKDIADTSNSGATVSESDKSNADNNASDNNSSKNGWKTKDGKWNYYKDGNVSTGWTEIDGIWYYFEGDGTMDTGWKKINDIWYYFDENGAMSIGWKAIDGNWYYFDKKGEMLSNTVVNGYLVAFDGRVIY